jgi:hypothetical protein
MEEVGGIGGWVVVGIDGVGFVWKVSKKLFRKMSPLMKYDESKETQFLRRSNPDVCKTINAR